VRELGLPESLTECYAGGRRKKKCGGAGEGFGRVTKQVISLVN